MSTPRARLTAQTTEQVRRQQIAYDRFHDAVAAFFGVNRTDLRCLDLLDLRGRQAAGELSQATGLTTGAVTTMLDRLERAGYVQRVRDPDDRRRVLVEATDLARERAQAVYEPFDGLIAPLFGHFTDQQITMIGEFLRITSEFYLTQIARIETLARGNG